MIENLKKCEDGGYIDPGGLVDTFATVEDARNYFIDPMGIKRVVEEVEE